MSALNTHTSTQTHTRAQTENMLVLSVEATRVSIPNGHVSILQIENVPSHECLYDTL